MARSWCSFSVLASCVLLAVTSSLAQGPYEPDWDSLSDHQDPGWFRDAKFGIYTHWGPVTVGSEKAAKGRVQWYGMAMYQPEDPAFEFHRKTFGDQREFGYKDVIPLFTAEKFDAEAWADLFAAAGAQFAGPVAIHHDNFAMWDSALTEWDSVDMGPHRDVTGELAEAIRAHGMRFIATFHHGFAWRYFEPSYQYDGANPKYAGLYADAHEPGAPPTKAFQDQWLAKVNEVVAKYEPDLIWFDFDLGDDSRNCITPEYRRRMFADYYNWAAARGKEVGVAHKHWEIHEYTGIIDFERGRMDTLTPFPWLTDTSVGPWFHQESSPYKSANDLVDVLVDIVSKNGCMLLNVGPAADGSIPPEAQSLLRGIGAWLGVNGEAIYATRPWHVFGEGPTENTGGGFSERQDKPYTAQDMRFTQSKDGRSVYVIALDWPGEPIILRTMKVAETDGDAHIALLGYRGAVPYQTTADGHLRIETPDLAPEARPCEHAFVFKLIGFELALDAGAAAKASTTGATPQE